MTKQTTGRSRSRIPDFASIEEEAEFWDTHDFTEFESEWKSGEDDPPVSVVEHLRKEAASTKKHAKPVRRRRSA